MAILNYTTQIAVEKTYTEIQKLLSENGARQVLTSYDDAGVLSSISFRIDYNGETLAFMLPANLEKILVVLREQRAPKKLQNKEQAARVAWRIIKDWLRAQFALIEAEQAEVTQVFLPYMQNPNNGVTLFESFKEKGPRALGHD